MNTKKLLALFLSLLMLLTVVTTATLAEDVDNDPFEDDKWDAPTIVTTTTTTPTDIPEESSSSETTPSSSETTVPSSEPSSSETTPSSSETTVPSSEPSSSETTVPSTEPTENTTQPTASTTVPTEGTTQPTQGTTQPTESTTQAPDPTNPDSSDSTTQPTESTKPTETTSPSKEELKITVKNSSGTIINKKNKMYLSYNKAGKRQFVFEYTLSDPNAKVVWKSKNEKKLKVVSDNGKKIRIKIVCKNPVKNFTDYVAVNCKYEGEVIFTLNLTYIQLDKVSNLKVIGKKLTWSEVPYANGYVVYDLTAKKEKVVTKASFKATPGHSYKVQAFEKTLGMKYYSKKSVKAFSLKAPKIKITAGKKFIKVTAKKVKNADKFQVRYRIKGKWITKTFKTKKALNKKIKKLKTGKVYKVQLRVCKNKNSFSNWTKIKKIKVK